MLSFLQLKNTSWRNSIPAKHTKKILPFLFLFVAEIQPFKVFFNVIWNPNFKRNLIYKYFGANWKYVTFFDKIFNASKYLSEKIS